MSSPCPDWNEPCDSCGHRITAHRGPREGVLLVRYYCEFCDCTLIDEEIVSSN